IKAAHSHARQVTEFDRRLLQFVEARQSDPEPPWRLEGAWGVEVLRMLARSGRGHWQNEQAPALTVDVRSEEHTSELQSLMRISYAVFCLKKKQKKNKST